MKKTSQNVVILEEEDFAEPFDKRRPICFLVKVDVYSAIVKADIVIYKNAIIKSRHGDTAYQEHIVIPDTMIVYTKKG